MSFDSTALGKPQAVISEEALAQKNGTLLDDEPIGRHGGSSQGKSRRLAGSLPQSLSSKLHGRLWLITLIHILL